MGAEILAFLEGVGLGLVGVGFDLGVGGGIETREDVLREGVEGTAAADEVRAVGEERGGAKCQLEDERGE